MLFALFILIQSQEPPRLSKLVIAAAVLFFIAGISLLVYFLRRLKAGEKEVEEDWNATRSSLFVQPPAPSPHTGVDAERAQPAQPEEIEPVAISPQRSETRILASDPAFEELHEIAQSGIEAEPEAAPPVVHPRAHEPEIKREERGTEMLASPLAQVEPPVRPEAPRETMPFGEDVWAELEKKEQEISAPAQPTASDQTALLHSQLIEQASEPQTGKLEPELDARVEHRASREPFEPPTIKPITPREQSEMVRNQQPAPRPTRDLYAGSTRNENAASEPPVSNTRLYGQSYESEARAEQQTSTPYEQRGTRELAAEPAISDVRSTPVSKPVETSFTPAHVNRGRERRAPAGAVLGLPTEGAQGPMVLGTPVRSKDEIGIGELSRYGKPLVKDGGRGGTITLLLVILIIGGALAVYLFVPSVNSQVNAWVARMRGVDPNRSLLSGDPKAMIFASRVPETNKNMVKAKGSIDNISKETLEGLAIEVRLERANNQSPEILKIPITPEQLEPNAHGVYEFEYDGNRETGFIKYTITRLLSNDKEVRYTSPNQK
jgi:hypothetical protein